jgi:hypothetical protein
MTQDDAKQWHQDLGAQDRALLDQLAKQRQDHLDCIEGHAEQAAALSYAMQSIIGRGKARRLTTVWMLRAYVDTLAPGALVDVDEAMAWGKKHGWLSAAVDPRRAVLTRLAAQAGHSAWVHRDGRYFKEIIGEEAAAKSPVTGAEMSPAGPIERMPDEESA